MSASTTAPVRSSGVTVHSAPEMSDAKTGLVLVVVNGSSCPPIATPPCRRRSGSQRYGAERLLVWLSRLTVSPK